MSGSQKHRHFGMCIYCGALGPLTDDHIPPKSLFRKPRPLDLITVPCCEACNNGAAMDDEYFRAMIVLRMDVFEHPEVRDHIWPKVRRSLSRQDKIGFAKAFVNTLHPITLKLKEGKQIRTGIYLVEPARIHRVVERIIKGLFYHEYGYRLSELYKVDVWAEEELNSLNEEGKQAVAELIKPVYQNQVKVIGADVFSYQHASIEEEPNASVWLLSFYDRARFLAMTAPKDLQLPLASNE